ncbi:MAG: hypothetical protein RJA98_684, partial [Pseudomonadota bacterium]
MTDLLTKAREAVLIYDGTYNPDVFDHEKMSDACIALVRSLGDGDPVAVGWMWYGAGQWVSTLSPKEAFEAQSNGAKVYPLYVHAAHQGGAATLPIVEAINDDRVKYELRVGNELLPLVVMFSANGTEK